MRRKKEGTDIWCPKCKEIRTCAANSTTNFMGTKQRLQSSKFPDIKWFQRGRICLECDHNFVTVELDYAFLKELIKHRENFSHLIKHVGELLNESKKLKESQDKQCGTLDNLFKTLLELERDLPLF